MQPCIDRARGGEKTFMTELGYPDDSGSPEAATRHWAVHLLPKLRHCPSANRVEFKSHATFQRRSRPRHSTLHQATTTPLSSRLRILFIVWSYQSRFRSPRLGFMFPPFLTDTRASPSQQSTELPRQNGAIVNEMLPSAPNSTSPPKTGKESFSDVSPSWVTSAQ